MFVVEQRYIKYWTFTFYLYDNYYHDGVNLRDTAAEAGRWTRAAKGRGLGVMGVRGRHLWTIFENVGAILCNWCILGDHGATENVQICV